VPIIRRNYCIYATLGTCYFVWMSIWHAHCRPKHVEKRNGHTTLRSLATEMEETA